MFAPIFTFRTAARALSTLSVLAALALASALRPVHTQGTGPGTGPAAVQVTGAVRVPVAFDLSALRALSQGSATVGGKAYAGTPLWTLLSSAGLVMDGSRRNPGVSMFVVTTGQDGYKAVFSLAELDPALDARAAVLVATTADRQPLPDGGMTRLVVPGDTKPSRAVFRPSTLHMQSAP